ncbi:MAG: PTS N-acetylglucosamine transporter subunit IIBC [Bacteroidetes bacterium]|nr:PTS N-acetylglucosamine transporter subunit IIBC [Bacteroidota bacterium]
MRNYLITSHGYFAAKILYRLEIIAGKNKNIKTIEAYTDGNKSIDGQIDSVIEKLDSSDELIIFTDLMGGSITNQLLKYTLRKNTYIVSGVNLPLLLDITLAETDIPASEVIEAAIENAREQILFVNKLIPPSND